MVLQHLHGTLNRLCKKYTSKKSVLFSDEDSILMRTKNGTRCKVISELSERDCIVHDMHAGIIGGAHFGQDATIRKVNTCGFFQQQQS